MTDPGYRRTERRTGDLPLALSSFWPALWLLLTAGFATAEVAAAGNISLTMTAQAGVQDDALSVLLTLQNGGDEAARSVSAALHFKEQVTHGDVHSQLDPGDSFDTSLLVPVGQLGKGRWPYRIAVSYADANGFPFHALLVGLVELEAPPPAEVAVLEFNPLPIPGSGSLEAKVKNVSAAPRVVDVTLHLPQELEASQPTRSVALAPWETREVRFSLVNRAALIGSKYGIFLSAEYDDEVHQAVVAPATLEIAPQESLFPRRLGPLMWLLSGLLIVAWALFVAVRRRRGGPEPPPRDAVR